MQPATEVSPEATEEGLAQWVEALHKNNIATFIEHGGEMHATPLLILHATHVSPSDAEGILAVPLAELGGEDSIACGLWGKILAAAVKADAYCLLMDTWVVRLNKERAREFVRSATPVSEHPERVEALMSLGDRIGSTGPISLLTYYKRGPDSKPQDFEDVDAADGIAARNKFGNMLDYADVPENIVAAGRALVDKFAAELPRKPTAET